MKYSRVFITVLIALGIFTWLSPSLHAATAYELDRDGRQARRDLFRKNEKAGMLARQACAFLIFPTIVKAGFIFGGQGGEGVLIGCGSSPGASAKIRPA